MKLQIFVPFFLILPVCLIAIHATDNFVNAIHKMPKNVNDFDAIKFINFVSFNLICMKITIQAFLNNFRFLNPSRK